MSDTYIRTLTVVAAIGAGLSAGVYFAFSTFVMSGIRKLSPSQAISAMNGMNKAAPASPLFMLVLFGTGVVCVLLVIAGLQHRGDPAAGWQIAGAALLLVALVITMVYHVPHNDQLLKTDPMAAGASDTWRNFYPSWIAWNHARTLTSLAGTVSLVLALRAR